MIWILRLRSHLSKKARDQQGMTLLEVIVSLMIMGMVVTILYSFLLMGVSMYKRVTVETQLRNQGDMLYSRLIAELNKATTVKPVFKLDDSGSLVEDKSQIQYVKSSSNSMNYIQEYLMKVEDNKVEVFLVDNEGKKLHEDDPAIQIFAMDRTQFSLNASFDVPENMTDLVNVRLDFSRLQGISSDQKAQITIRSQVKLSRNL
jgi:prepilin-type N-terminal cleavage/methylation domain-containing protein